MKILIISHNPITRYQSMGKTMLTLFKMFKKEELCQLYIYPTVPDIDYCSSYYRITDKDILNSYFNGFSVRGCEIKKSSIQENNTMYENPKDEKCYRPKKHSKRFLRDILWKHSRWNNLSLENWIKKEKPTSIFVAPGDAELLYDMALKISKQYELPIITYLCDDYYFVSSPSDFWGRVRHNRLKLKIEELLTVSKHLIAICDELLEPYKNRFPLNCSVVMTGTNVVAKRPKQMQSSSVITYMGNIRCNRYCSLIDIGKELDMINKETGNNYSLEIYTDETDERMLSELRLIDSVRLKGFVTGNCYQQVFESAQFFLHVEAFDRESIDVVKHSISTKIAECLASGTPLIAYGPEQVASMQHLIKNQCAITIVSKAGLKNCLLNALQDNQKKQIVVNNALKTAREFHCAVNNSNEIRRIIDKVEG